MTRVFRKASRMAAVAVVASILLAAECQQPADPGGTTNPPAPVPTTVTLDKPTVNFDAVGATEQLTATVKDQSGATMTNVTVTWSSNATQVATVSNAGLVTSVANGSATITARAGTVNATSAVTVAQVATQIARVSGDGQSAPPSATLPLPLVVEVQDRLGAPVQGVTVDFAAATGSGSVNPTSGSTGANGRTSTMWTLGSGEGSQTASAASGTLTGSPVGFSATATSLFISSIAPDTIVEGASATITGQGFSGTPANNTVTVGGVAATVVSATATSITFTVPTTDCQPAQNVNVQVTVASVNSNTVSHPRQPAQFVDLAVGGYKILQSPGSFCLQFRGTLTPDAYVFGVGAAAETPGATMTHRLIATAGAAFPSAPFQATPLPVSGAGPRVTAPSMSVEEARIRARHLVAENAIREWEERNILNRGLPLAPRAPRAPQAVPSVGDTLKFRVPNIEGNPCTGYQEITTIVKVVGAAGIFVVDTLNPVQDSLTDAELQAYSDTFDNHIFDQDTLYLGLPTDLDANQRVFVVLTHEVNKFSIGAAGFVFSGDLVSRMTCASSDNGEIFYGHVPDPANTSGTGARSKASIKNQMPTLIAHEFAHNIQQSRRLVGANLSRWEAEGQATFMEEILGHSIEGNQSRQNYGTTTANMGTGQRWYQPQFYQLSQYYGYQPAAGANPADAPEKCTLLAASSTTTPCNTFHFYGASYLFMRFVSDHYGPGVTSGVGGEAQLHRDWIGKNTSLSGVPNVENLLGVDFDSLFSRWAMMQWADDRIVGADPSITLLSWKLTEIMNALPGAVTLPPVARTFTAFTADREVRGGSHDFSRISSAAGHGFFSIKVRDTGGGVLGMAMRPQLWIVREQ